MTIKERCNRVLGALLSVAMVITMLPMFVFATGEAKDGNNTVSSPVSVSGEWEHQKVNDGGDYDGFGTNYISMWVKNTDFVCVQTVDNQTFTLNSEVWAMKNDGINTCQLTAIEFFSTSDDIYKNVTFNWKEITTCCGNDDPTAYTLPGVMGSGYSNQLKNNLAKWNGTFDITVNGGGIYNGFMDIKYKSGATGMGTRNHSTASDKELINYTIEVIDLRELISELAFAKDLLNDPAVTATQKAALEKEISSVESSFVLDGTVAYTQNSIDNAVENLKKVTRANFTEYLDAVDAANTAINSTLYSQEGKDAIAALLTKKDTILAMGITDQDKVDAATKELYDAMEAAAGTIPEMNSVDSTQEESRDFYLKNNADDDNDSYDTVKITLSHRNVYLDKSENMSLSGFTYRYYSKYGSNGLAGSYYKQFVAGPLSPECLDNGDGNLQWIGGIENPPVNYNKYFTNFGVLDPEVIKPLELKRTRNVCDITYRFDGEPLQTTGDGATIYINAYAELGDYWGNSISKYTSEYVLTPAGSNEGIPHFQLYVYDKAPLKAAIEKAVKIHNDAANFNEYLNLIASAKEIYAERKVTDTQVKAAADALNNFTFTYKIETSVTPENGGSVYYTLVSGTQSDVNTFSLNSVVTLTAVPAADYEFTGWENKTAETARTITITDNAKYIANFKFVRAIYSVLTTLVSNVPTDTSVYSAESVAALNSALENANTVIAANYGKSNQSIVDDAVTTLQTAIDGLVRVVFDPCDYSHLDEVLEYAAGIITENDGRYKSDVWENYKAALTAAKAVDRTLTNENAANQALIDDLTEKLALALGALNATENQNFADTATLDAAKNDAKAEIGETNDGKYNDDVWNDYKNAIDNAQNIIDNPPFDNETGRQQVADAEQAVKDAVTALKDTANQNGLCDYTVLDAAKTNAAEIPAENSGKYTADAWNKYQAALNAANSVKDGMYNDDGGINQKVIDDAASALNAALAELESTRNYVVDIKDENGNTTDTVYVGKDSDTGFGDIKGDLTLPQDTTDKKYTGWEDENGNTITDDTVITGDMVITPAYDLTVITPDKDTTIKVDKVDTIHTYMVGITVGANTVAEIKANLENDSRTIIVVKNDVELSDDALVGTGYIIKCVSKADHSIVYEEATVILYGDVNGDGLVDGTDYQLMKNKGYAFDNSVITDGTVYMIAADLNDDGVVDGFDVALLDLQLSGAKEFDQTVEYYK